VTVTLAIRGKGTCELCIAKDRYDDLEKQWEEHWGKIDEHKSEFWGAGGSEDVYDAKIEKIIETFEVQYRKRIPS